jgi:hypothetical protein
MVVIAFGLVKLVHRRISLFRAAKRRVATIAADWPRGGNVGKPSQSVFSKIEPTKLIERSIKYV